MNPRINQLVRTLLHKDSLDQCSLQELRQFADRHPFFGAAQLLLTKKLQTEDPGTYNEQLQKTFLFFNNPLWVEQLLNENGNAEIFIARDEEPAPYSPKQVAEPEFKQYEVETKTVEAIAPVVEVSKIEVPEQEKTEEVEPVKPVSPLKIEPVVNKKDELIFEPFHTVDYFASQGIRVKEDEKPTDKFGKQLKSFTEWLKSMKKLPIAEVVARTEPIAEKKIEEMAEVSLKEREVVTEAMAEVWEKQGNAAKAIAIYDKLSLLEPSKSAYFAAKIDALKKSD